MGFRWGCLSAYRNGASFIFSDLAASPQIVGNNLHSLQAARRVSLMDETNDSTNSK